jgi:predicted dienelactone hydrolase
MDDPKVAPWFKVYRPADMGGAVTATGSTLPVIVWANGGCFRVAAAWELLYKRWASGGFVVLALDVGPDGNPLVATTVADHAKLVDWALEAAEKDGSPYAGKLDKTRIVAAGNSCGGVTALGVAASDKRVKSVFVLSGSSALASTDARIMSAISAPVGYIVGGAEDIAAPNASADYDAMTSGVPAMIVNRSSGDHVLVSTDATILAQEAAIALDWMDLCLYGTPAAHDALTSATICSGCDPGIWKLKSKNLDALKK